MIGPIAPLVRELATRSVRFVLIGVSGANLYSPTGQAVFVTKDYDFFMPPDAGNLVLAWEAAEAARLELWLGDEPLDRPRDRWLADRVVERRALTRVTGPDELMADLTLVMKGFDFDTVWQARRDFVVEDVEVPTARLTHIVESKRQSGRDKDKLFLATHKDALEQLFRKDLP